MICPNCGKDMSEPYCSAEPRHQFKGRLDRTCDICGLPDRAAVHRAAPAPAGEPRAVAWLIESVSGRCYWSGTNAHSGWSVDHVDAVRFAREQDALATIKWLRLPVEIRATEHVWFGAEPPPPAPQDVASGLLVRYAPGLNERGAITMEPLASGEWARYSSAAAALAALAQERDEQEKLIDGMCEAVLYKDERIAEAQAKIDRLMLEYCPDEMTPEQRENWGKHQVPVAHPPPPAPQDVAGHANKVRTCIYIAADATAAKDVDETIGKLAAALESMRAERDRQSAYASRYHADMMQVREQRDKAERERDEARELLGEMRAQRGEYLGAVIDEGARLDWLIEYARITRASDGAHFSVFIPGDVKDIRTAIDAARKGDAADRG